MADTSASNKYAPVVVLVLVVALAAVAWWLNRPADTSTSGKPTASSIRKVSTSPEASRTRGGTTRTTAGIDPDTGLPWVEQSALPKEAQQVLAQIDRGGPYAYDKDGSTFGNLEGRLPKKQRGYYKEYTVKTPGEGDRGARRIVTGAGDTQFFWTDDHYETFARVRR
ncbi:ribonuclease domain-containing protein [Mariniluteicoccus endophyticus]